MDEGPSNSLISRLKSLFGLVDDSRAAQKLEEEILELIDEGAEKGVISSTEGDMIQSIFQFGDTVVREIMIPRTDIVAISETAFLNEVIETALGQGHSRLPVYKDDIDHVTGILHVKNLLAHFGAPADQPLPPGLTKHPFFIPEGKKVGELLRDFQTQKTHMAVVLDEYGGTAGLVTLEDIIEEIVGEIEDESDTDENKIVRLTPSTILVDARLNLEELGEYLDLDLPEGKYESVGGFIIDITGNVPQENEQVEYGDLLITIREADERKISQVEITRRDPTETVSSGNS